MFVYVIVTVNFLKYFWVIFGNQLNTFSLTKRAVQNLTSTHVRLPIRDTIDNFELIDTRYNDFYLEVNRYSFFAATKLLHNIKWMIFSRFTI